MQVLDGGAWRVMRLVGAAMRPCPRAMRHAPPAAITAAVINLYRFRYTDGRWYAGWLVNSAQQGMAPRVAFAIPIE